MPYDTRAHDAASAFLDDCEPTEAEVASLASAINDAVDRWFESNQPMPRPTIIPRECRCDQDVPCKCGYGIPW